MSIPKSDPFLGKARRTIAKYSMLSSGSRVVIAVSGGPDSVCLLSVLHALSAELDLSLHVAHLDHMFRGKESADEAVFVSNLAKKLGIAATIEKIDVPAFCRERGLSAQVGAREVRYAFLAGVAHAVKAARIATGHTASDQAETFLLRLLRGAGVAGLSAIPPKRDNIIRPILEVTREEVLEYLQSNGLDYMSDPSNAKPLYTRNRIRMDVLPVLRQFNPRIVETLASEAALLRDEDEAAEARLKSIAAEVMTTEQDGIVLQREQFNALPRAFQRRLLRKAVDEVSAGRPGLSMVQVDEALAFIASARTGRAMRLPDGLAIAREYEKFVLHVPAAEEGFSHSLAVPGVTVVPELGLEVETKALKQGEEGRTSDEGEENYLWQALFDYDKMGPLLTLRSRRPGDRFHPAGMGGRSRKLQDYLVDVKVPRRQRASVPLLCSGEDILWVIGHRTDERFLVGTGTKRVLVVRVDNKGDV